MGRRIALAAKVLGAAFLVWMWIYAFVLAPRESANFVRDLDWSARSEATCTAAQAERAKFADLSRIDPSDIETVKKKADIIDAATDTVENAIDAIEKDMPSTAKGRDIVPDWIADYRRYVQDRRDYAAVLRTGKLVEFSESQVEGLPITERIGKFARENKMPSCQPPRDLQA